MTQPPIPDGSEPPPSAFPPVWPQQTWFDPSDPLVNPIPAGIGGWFGRINATFQRSWRPIAAIFALTHLLPSLVLQMVLNVAAVVALLPWYERFIEASLAGDEPPTFDVEPALLLGYAAAFVAVVLVTVLVNALGYAAATRAVTRQAAGEPTSFGDALGYGLRRCFGLGGWNLLTGLLVLLGFVACLLPGVYVLAGLALVGPIYLFERRNPFGRSFGILHGATGRVLGRLLMIVVITIGGSLVGGGIENMISLVVQSVSGGYVAATVVGTVVSAVIALPFTMFQFVAILLTYAEQRGSEAPTTTLHLAAEL